MTATVPESPTEVTAPLSDADQRALGVRLLEGCERLAAADDLVAMGVQPTEERIAALVAERAAEEHAALVRQQARALVDATPLGRAYQEHVAAATQRVLEASQ